MAKLTAFVLAGLFAFAVTAPSVMAACASHTVTASTTPTTIVDSTTTPTTPVPETKTGG